MHESNLRMRSQEVTAIDTMINGELHGGKCDAANDATSCTSSKQKLPYVQSSKFVSKCRFSRRSKEIPIIDLSKVILQ